MIIQLTGLSGAGKTTLAVQVKGLFQTKGLEVEIIDGDVYRKTLCKDLGFSKQDRCENIRRLGIAANTFVVNGKVAIIAAINPYEEIRAELAQKYGAKTVWIKCKLDILAKRDTKGLYRRALLPDNHPEKLFNLTGINDVYEIPVSPDLIINTGNEPEEQSIQRLFQFMIQHCQLVSSPPLHTIQKLSRNKKG